jgi:hypothetical protein
MSSYFSDVMLNDQRSKPTGLMDAMLVISLPRVRVIASLGTMLRIVLGVGENEKSANH